MTLGQITVYSEEIVTVPEAARQLSRPKMTLYRWIKKQQLVAIELGGVLFIPVTEVARLKAKAKG